MMGQIYWGTGITSNLNHLQVVYLQFHKTKGMTGVWKGRTEGGVFITSENEL